MPTVVCHNCGISFERLQGPINHTLKRGNKLYCSTECRMLFHQCRKTASEKKEYMRLYNLTYRAMNKQRIKEGKKREYVKICERVLGRPLKYPQQVHHVDGDRNNNANSNLVICEDYAYHFMLHTRAKSYKATGKANNLFCYKCGTWKHNSEYFTRASGGKVYPCKVCAKAILRGLTSHKNRKKGIHANG